MRTLPRLTLAAALSALAAPSAALAAGPELVTKQSPALGGAPADGGSGDLSLSRDGRLIAFASDSPNLSTEDVDEGREDVFLHDRRSGETTLVNVPGPLAYAPSISADGSAVVFVTAPDYHAPGEVRVRDLRTGAIERVGTGSTTIGYAYPQAPPRLSADGRIVVFESTVAGRHAVMAFDRRTRRTRRLGPRGAARPVGLAVSGNGRVVSWSVVGRRGTSDTWAASVLRYDRRTRKRTRVDRYGVDCCLINTGIYDTALSHDGRRLAWVTRDRSARARIRVRDAGGRRRTVPGADVFAPTLSADGRWLGFLSPPGRASVRDLRRGRTRHVAESTTGPALSADGRWAGVVTEKNTGNALGYVAEVR